MKRIAPFTRREPDMTDAEIDAIVAEAIAAEAAAAGREAMPPSSAIVWWRAQMRARQEAARTVERPLTIVHALAIACGVGLLSSLVGTVLAGLNLPIEWLTTIDFTSRWIMVPMTAALVSVLVASIAVYLIFADE